MIGDAAALGTPRLTPLVTSVAVTSVAVTSVAVMSVAVMSVAVMKGGRDI